MLDRGYQNSAGTWCRCRCNDVQRRDCARSVIMLPLLIGGGIKRWCCLTSVCLLRTSGLNREQRGLGRPNWHRGSPRHTWLGHHFQGQKVKVTRPLCSPPCWHVRRLQRWAWECVGHGKLLLRCRLLGGARRFGAHGGREGGGISCRPAAYSLFSLVFIKVQSSLLKGMFLLLILLCNFCDLVFRHSVIFITLKNCKVK